MAAGCLPGDPSNPALARGSDCKLQPDEIMALRHKWYYTKEEIENHSPSRMDGISFKEESHLRQLYCRYLQELGMEIKVPQKTIASALVLCHRFYMRQSHAKNYWQTIAAACVFLASKSEETPCFLKDVVVVGYKLAYKFDPTAPQRIKQKEVYEKQKETLLHAERLLLATLNFELNIELPYKPLVAAVKNLGISHAEVPRVAWNYVNDWLRTTFCLQYKPHYIAAGSLYLAAKRQKVKLPSSGKVWWMQFDVSPKILDGVVQHMVRFEERAQKHALPSPGCKEAQPECKTPKATFSSPESCVSNGSGAQDTGKKNRLESEGASRTAESVSNGSVAAQDTKNRIRMESDGASRVVKVETVSKGSVSAQDTKNRIRMESEGAARVVKPETVLNASVAAQDTKNRIRMESEGAGRVVKPETVLNASVATQDTKNRIRIESERAARVVKAETVSNASVAAQDTKNKIRMESEGASRVVKAETVPNASVAAQDTRNRIRMESEGASRVVKVAEPVLNASVAAQDTKNRIWMESEGASRVVKAEPLSNGCVADQGTKNRSRMESASRVTKAESALKDSVAAQDTKTRTRMESEGASRVTKADPVLHGSVAAQDTKTRTRMESEGASRVTKAESVLKGSFVAQDAKNRKRMESEGGASRVIKAESVLNGSAQGTNKRSRLESEGASKLIKVESGHQSKQQVLVPDSMKKVEAYKRSSTRSPRSGAEVEKPGQRTELLSEQKKSGSKRPAPADDASHSSNLDVLRIKERMKQRKLEKAAETKLALEARGDLDDSWIEMELESGLEK